MNKNQKSQNKFIKWIKSPASNIWLFIIMLILLNLVAARAFFRFDITGPKSYSLSKSSKEIVKTIEEPLSVKVFFSSNLPSPYANVEQYVKDILVEYKNAANSNFSYEYFNMDKEENLSQAQNYGLNQLQIREVKNNELGFKNAYMGIVLTYADQIEVLDGITSSDGLEYKLTTAIGKIISNTNVLSGLSSAVKVTLYKSEALSEFNLGNFDKIDGIVNAAFSGANKKFDGKMEFYSENPSSLEAQELSERYGLQPVTWKNNDGSTGMGSLGLVLEYDDKFKVMPFVPQRLIFQYVISGLDNLEENLEANVESLVSKTNSVAYITGHGELDLDDERNGAGNFSKLCSDIYSFEKVNLDESDIPSDCQTVIVNGPKTEFSEAELYKLDQHLMKGGSLMLFLDPYEVVENQNQYQQYQMPPSYNPVKTGLEKLLSSYGIECGTNYVLDSACYSQNDQQYGKLNFNYIPLLQKDLLNQKNPITKNLGYVLLMQNGSIDVSKALEDKNINTQILAKSSSKAWTVSDQFILSPLYIQPPSNKEDFGTYNMIVLLEGKFKSPYEENPTLKNDLEKNSGDENFVNVDTHLKSSSQSGKIFLSSSSYITGPQLISGNGSEPIEMLVRNAVDYMNGSEDFCAMRTKNLNLNVLKDSSVAASSFAKYFNEIGLALLVAICGLIVFIARKNHREKIRMIYDPEDSRIEDKKSKK